MLSRQNRPFGRLILALEIITNILHLHPLHARLTTDILNQSLQHEDDVWMAADVGMDRHREAEIVVFPVKVIKVVSPQVLDVLWVHPAVGIGGFFDKHHRGKVVEVPAARDLDETGVGAFF